MDLPKHCFCGCGRHVGTRTENMNGIVVTMEIGYWLSYTSILKAAAEDIGGSDVERAKGADGFLEDGRAVWFELRDAVHGGYSQDRKSHRATKRWMKFGRKTREKIAKDTGMGKTTPDLFKPMPPPEQIHAWIKDGTPLPMD